MMSNAPPNGDFDHLTPEQLRHFYEVERTLARRLKDAPREARLGMYGSVYDELFASVPAHPQLRRKSEDGTEQSARVSAQTHLVRRVLKSGDVFLEVGAGDCALSFSVARFATRVYGLDVSETVSQHDKAPANFQLIISDGISVPLPDASVDVAYSNQLMEHLHPDDAATQLREIRRVLKPGGRYLCVTPSALTGPHDVSRFFDEVATGFHLKEYTYSELSQLFFAAGFGRTAALLGHQRSGLYAKVPIGFVTAIEHRASCAIEGKPRARRLVEMSRWTYRLLSDVRLIGYVS